MRDNQSGSTFPRRTLARGIAWAAPTVAISAAAPAYAASAPCMEAVDEIFTERQAFVRDTYFCNGQPLKIQINLYQAAGALNGYAQTVAINVKNLSSCTIAFDSDLPLSLSIQVRNANRVTSGSRRRNVTGVSTSWGASTSSRTEFDIYDAPIGTVQDEIRWAMTGSDPLPGQGQGDNEADLAIQFGDGLAGLQRWMSYVTITPSMPTFAPTFEETGALDSPACREYYAEKLTTFVEPYQLYAFGSRTPYNTEPGVPIDANTTLDSRVIGNNSSGGDASKDGIW